MDMYKILVYRLLCIFLLVITAKLTAQTNQKSQMVVAQITLKSASGASILDKEALVTSETVGKYQPAPETIRKARKLLKSDGFVVSESGIGLSATTSIENFERVFGLKIIETKVKQYTRYETEKEIPVPDHWKKVVESVDLPEPIEYH